MRVKNDIDRFNLCLDVANLISDDYDKFELTSFCVKELIKHSEYIRRTGKDLDIVDNWKWSN